MQESGGGVAKWDLKILVLKGARGGTSAAPKNENVKVSSGNAFGPWFPGDGSQGAKGS